MNTTRYFLKSNNLTPHRRGIVLAALLSTLQSFAQGPELYKVERLPFNTADYNEMGAGFYEGGIVFASDRKNDVFISYKDAGNKSLLDIYYSSPENSWKTSEVFSNDLRTNFHEGPACFSADGKIIYFTRNNYFEKKIGDSYIPNTLGIFIAERENNGWKNIRPFRHNSREYSIAHPSLSQDGKTLYFISDMPGGFGGSDIYVSYLDENNEWSELQNLGASINTNKNEVFPFIHSSGKLFFSSEAHNSIGGLDIFYSELISDKWSKPKPVESPVNSASDDFSFIIDEKEQGGFFTSSREGSDDIYSLESLFPQFENCDSMQQNSYCYVFYEASSVNIDTLPLIYEWNLGDGTKTRDLEAEHCFEDTGTYLVELNIVDTITNEIFFNQASYELAVENVQQVFINAPDTVQAGTGNDFDGLQTYLPGFDINNYYWQFGDGRKAIGNKISHAYVQPGTYAVQLGVIDANGNKKCAYKNIVVQQHYTPVPQVKKQPGAIASTGHREKSLSLFNDADTTTETKEKVYTVEITRSVRSIPLDDAYFQALVPLLKPEEHYLEEEKLYSYTVGQSKNLIGTYSLFSLVKSKGYKDAVVKSYKQKVFSLDEIGNASEEELDNAILRIQNIYFASGRYDVPASSHATLDKVADLLHRFEQVKIIISAHTDAVGSDEMNLALSQKRAESINDYLISKGINKNRLIAKGYGETKPIASNSTPENRALNRRIEFQLTVVQLAEQ